MKIKDLVKDNRVQFEYYRDNKLWYNVMKRTGDNKSTEIFIFPVPINDIGNATFNREDKAILFMRYIRKYLEVIEKEKIIDD